MQHKLISGNKCRKLDKTFDSSPGMWFGVQKELHIDPTRSCSQSTRDEFRKYDGVDRKDFATIEYLIRKGNRQLETYKGDGIRNVLR
jgi:hypothetical protein